MKTKILSLFTITFLLLFACQLDDKEMLETENNTILEKKEVKTEMVTVPFKSNFSVWDKSDFSESRCAPLYPITMVGNGNVTHLGNMNVTFIFCYNPEFNSYENTDVTFIAANGDELYARIESGQMGPNDEANSEYYQEKFNDEMTFVGGTGRFEGAEGTAWTHAYIHNFPEDFRTDFFSTGTLKLKKGK
jgi:hypothetical protein